MLFTRRLRLLLSAIVVCIGLGVTSLASAKSWPVMPYGFWQVGGDMNARLREEWRNKLTFGGVGISVGGGCLLDPVYSRGFLTSGEVLYHGILDPAAKGNPFRKHGVFLVAKVTIPLREGQEVFLKLGPGESYFTGAPALMSPWQFSAIAVLGGNFHLSDKWYVLGQLSCLYPFEKGKEPNKNEAFKYVFYQEKQTVKLGVSCGLHWHA